MPPRDVRPITLRTEQKAKPGNFGPRGFDFYPGVAWLVLDPYSIALTVGHVVLPNVDTESVCDPAEVLLAREDRRPVVAGESVLAGRAFR